MKQKNDLNQCMNEAELFMRVSQNFLIGFLEENKLYEALYPRACKYGKERPKYISRKRLDAALSQNASAKQVAHALFEVWRYCLETEDCHDEFVAMLLQLIETAIRKHGKRLHLVDYNIRGRISNIHKS